MALYAFDGTWNSAVVDDGLDEANDTNVVHFYDAYGGPKWYISGPGTRLGKLGKAVGGVAGAGARERLEESYKQLRRSFEAGDRTIDIVGFSRGAAIALDFANLIRDRGVIDVETEQVIADNVPIRFLGLWDVVGSFGIPIGERVFQKINLGHKLSVPDNVEYAFHAISLDDRRQSFRVTRQLNAYEVWFRGVHSDVGGGNGNAGLSCIALRWMLSKAKAAGLPIDDAAVVKRDDRIDPEAALRLPKDFVINDFRELWADDRFHYTVSDRPGHNNPPAASARESRDDETRALRRAELPRRDPPSRKSRPGDGQRTNVIPGD